MKTEIFGLALAFVMVVAIGATVLPAMAAENTSSEGSFTLGNEAPTVTSIALYESDGSTPETAMDPTIEYVVKIEAADTNTLDDLSEIEVIIRVNGTGGDDDVNNKATYKWTNGATPVWTKEGPAGLWSLVTVGSTWPDPLTATSGE